jgi:tetratricopeptide (TPR) repeat protein
MGGSFTERDVEKVLADIAAPLDYLHDQGIVHLDLKPHNLIYVGGNLDGVLKIADFGISRSLKEQIGRSSAGFDLEGTLCYMSPEQLRNKVCDRRADIYAIGIILYHLLTGKFPFELDAAHPERVIEWHLCGPGELPQLQHPWRAVIEKCLTRNQEQRFASCREILDDLERVRSLPPPHYLDFSSAYDLMQAGKSDEAALVFKTVIDAAPQSAEAHAAAGHCYLLEKNFQNAIDSFSTAINIDPRAHWHTWRGMTFEQLNQHDKALSDFERAVKLDENDGLAWFRLGLVYQAKEQWHAAIENYTRAVEATEGKGWAFACRGECFLNLGHDDDALRDLNKAIELDPDNPAFFDSRAGYFERMKLHDEAVADFDRALHLQPTAERYLSRGRVLLSLRKPDEVIVDCHSSLQDIPDDPRAWYYIGLAHEQKQMFESAIDDYRKAESLGVLAELPEAIKRCRAAVGRKNSGFKTRLENRKHTSTSAGNRRQQHGRIGKNERNLGAMREQTREQIVVKLITDARRERGCGSFFCTPGIPMKRIKQAQRTFASGLAHEEILALYDGSIFGSAKGGLVLTSQAVHWRNEQHSEKNVLRYDQLNHQRMSLRNSDTEISLDGNSIMFSEQDTVVAKVVFDILRTLASKQR